MNVNEAIRKRRSVRAWQDRPVEDDVLSQVLDAARLAPSARNRQEWKFVAVRDAAVRAELKRATRGQDFVGDAPVVLVACALEYNYTMACGQKAYTVDLSIAVDHMQLQARELGLGSCWIGSFDHDTVQEVLGIPQSVRIVAVMPIGYPREWPDARPRKPLSEVVCYDRWVD